MNSVMIKKMDIIPYVKLKILQEIKIGAAENLLSIKKGIQIHFLQEDLKEKQISTKI